MEWSCEYHFFIIFYVIICCFSFACDWNIVFLKTLWGGCYWFCFWEFDKARKLTIDSSFDSLFWKSNFFLYFISLVYQNRVRHLVTNTIQSSQNLAKSMQTLKKYRHFKISKSLRSIQSFQDTQSTKLKLFLNYKILATNNVPNQNPHIVFQNMFNHQLLQLQYFSKVHYQNFVLNLQKSTQFLHIRSLLFVRIIKKTNFDYTLFFWSLDCSLQNNFTITAQRQVYCNSCCCL